VHQHDLLCKKYFRQKHKKHLKTESILEKVINGQPKSCNTVIVISKSLLLLVQNLKDTLMKITINLKLLRDTDVKRM
jgi:hypothetical protein